MKIVFSIPVAYLIVPGYLIAVILTKLSTEEFVNIAWDSAGVTTGPVTVPLVLAMGLGFGNAVGAVEGFGILSMASIGPIISVLLTGCGENESNEQASSDTAADSAAGLAAPVAKIENVKDTHWGVEVDDPYRYLEDQGNPEVVEWFKGQAGYTESVLAELPMREEIYERIQREQEDDQPVRAVSAGR